MIRISFLVKDFGLEFLGKSHGFELKMVLCDDETFAVTDTWGSILIGYLWHSLVSPPTNFLLKVLNYLYARAEMC